MTLIYEQESAGPQLHALIIGVGAYRHLPGGSDPVTHHTLGLQQLTGPPVSARAFATWVTADLAHPTAATGSVELLMSPAEEWVGPDGVSRPIETPTLANVKQAFDRWYDRCDEDADNVALLYFCGHGVERESQYLLLEDFGASDRRIMENAVDIGATYRGLARCKAREQFIFIDACRETPFALLQRLDARDAEVLIAPELSGDQRTNTALMFATSGGHKAYGRPQEQTEFTKWLLRALRGLGGRKSGAHWTVDVAGVQAAVDWLARRSDSPPQRPTSYVTGGGALHVCAGPPVVPVAVRCTPTEASQGAVAQLAPSAGAPVPPQAANGGWDFDVPADIYTLQVSFPPGTYPPSNHEVVAFPPGYDAPVVVGA